MRGLYDSGAVPSERLQYPPFANSLWWRRWRVGTSARSVRATAGAAIDAETGRAAAVTTLTAGAAATANAANAANASGADGPAPLSPARTGVRGLTRFTDPDTARATVDEPVPAKPARTTEREAMRGRDDDCARDGSDDLDNDTALGPLDPTAVSATATGIDAIAAPTSSPTPGAIANAPTRPTSRAEPRSAAPAECMDIAMTSLHLRHNTVHTGLPGATVDSRDLLRAAWLMAIVGTVTGRRST
jgi:hypothetical protein